MCFIEWLRRVGEQIFIFKNESGGKICCILSSCKLFVLSTSSIFKISFVSLKLLWRRFYGIEDPWLILSKHLLAGIWPWYNTLWRILLIEDFWEFLCHPDKSVGQRTWYFSKILQIFRLIILHRKLRIWTVLMITRSSSACHVGPLALERLIIFEQFWTHLNKFWTGWSTFDTFE